MTHCCGQRHLSNPLTRFLSSMAAVGVEEAAEAVATGAGELGEGVVMGVVARAAAARAVVARAAPVEVEARAEVEPTAPLTGTADTIPISIIPTLRLGRAVRNFLPAPR